MLDPKESRFWQATLLSGLMDTQGLTACWNAIPTGKQNDPQHIDRRLARQAVQAKALTLWQAQQLIAGRTSGFKVDRYVLLDLIGQGGMGRVYLARDSRLDREVALKILSPERVNNPRAIARFQREARVGAQLQHENLVRIYDFGESNGRFYLVMEFIEGKTIGTLISELGAIPSPTAVKLVRQVAMGLEHAHRKGLIHRDVNPYNILVTRDGTAKLADLGLAIDLADDDHVTREGATVGTFDYVAPEQARHSHSADIRSDIYSLGCSLYHMCTGQVPFPTPSSPEKLFAHQAMEATPLAQLLPNVAPGLSEVVQRMMRKLPDERYATPLQVVQALEPFEDEHAVVVQNSDRQPVTSETAAVAPGLITDQPDGARIGRGSLVPRAARTVADSIPSKTSRDATVAPDATQHKQLPSTIRSPDSNQGSDPEFPIDLILAPEPTLSEGLSRPKTRSGASHSETSAEADRLHSLPRNWRWILLAITMMVLAGVVFMAFRKPSADPTVTPETAKRSPIQTDDKQAANNSPEVKDKTRDGPIPLPDSSSPIVVRSDGGEETPFGENELLRAINTAMGRRGRVELRNRKPLKYAITTTAPFSLLSASGMLNIHAAEGAEPVIEVELNGSKPLLEMGSAVNLSLSGITFVARYPQTVTSSTTAPPAVITTAGACNIYRCAFKVATGSNPMGSRAIHSNMSAIKVDRCWFEGFDKAIDVTAGHRTHMQMSQTMIVAASPIAPAPSAASEEYGWGMKITFAGNKRPAGATFQPNIRLDHCTVNGAGLFDLTASPGPACVQVNVKECVVRANALLALDPKKNRKDQIEWQGEANQYDVRGHSWIVYSARQGTPGLSADITDMDSWLRTNSEKNPIRTKLNFHNDSGPRPVSLRPRDFAIEPPVPSEPRPGANSELVGPWSPP